MKDRQYFTHDYLALEDPKIQEMLSDIGASGYGLYWAIVETLYQQRGKYPLKAIKHIAHKAYSDTSTAMKVVKNYGLFEYDEEYFWSNAQLERQRVRDELIEKKRKHIIWDVYTNPDTKEFNISPLEEAILDKASPPQYIIEKLRGMQYSEFLNTPYWTTVSLFTKKRAKFRCEICGSEGPLQTHHKTYEHRGCESAHPEDLICLCEECHKKQHLEKYEDLNNEE